LPKKPRHKIPRQLPEEQFNAHVLPHLSIGSRGPALKLPLRKIFNYILKIIHTGVQWDQLEIEKDENGDKEIHYTRVFRVFQRWSNDGSLKNVFEQSVCFLRDNNKLDLSVVHGDGSLTPAKKGGEMVAYNGHKKIKGEAILPVVDRNVNVLSPYITAPANRNESPLFKQVIDNFKIICEKTGLVIKGSIFSWDASINCPKNRKFIFNAGMTPNINENKRNRKSPKRGRKQLFDVAIYKERLRTIERLFAWEDSFKKLLIRFERKSNNHFGMKLIAYTMINLRHFF
jgi:transposase